MRRTGGWFSSRRLRGVRLAIQPLLRGRKAIEPGDCRAEVDRFPFGIEAWRLQSVDPTKENVYKTGDALIAVGLRRPIERDQSGRHRDRLHTFALLDQAGVFGCLQHRGKIVILEFAFVFHWKELEAGVPASAYEGVNR